MGGRMKADYKNWVPKGMIYGFAAGTGVLAAGYAVAAKKMKGSSTKLRIGTKAVLGAGAAACGAATLWDDGIFMSKAEAKWMGLSGSALLVGKK